MSIFKESFKRFVKTQIKLREIIQSLGSKNNYQDFSDRFKGLTRNIKVDPSFNKQVNIDPGVFFVYNQKTCVIRASSGANLRHEGAKELEKKEDPLDNKSYFTYDQIKNDGLARRFVLQGGTINAGNGETGPMQHDYFGNLSVGSIAAKYNEKHNVEDPNVYGKIDAMQNQGLRAGIRGSTKHHTAYGDPSVLANPNSDGYGTVPMPGITSCNVRTKTAYGSLREAKLMFTCHNQEQLEVLELLFMRPGVPVLLEWGWTNYIDNDGKKQTSDNLPWLREWFNYGERYFNEEDNLIPSFLKKIIKKKEETGGNYDAVIGYVKNYRYIARPDGGYDCETELLAQGEILETLKGDTGIGTKEKDGSVTSVLKDTLEGGLEMMIMYSQVEDKYTKVDIDEDDGNREKTGAGKVLTNWGHSIWNIGTLILFISPNIYAAAAYGTYMLFKAFNQVKEEEDIRKGKMLFDVFGLGDEYCSLKEGTTEIYGDDNDKLDALKSILLTENRQAGQVETGATYVRWDALATFLNLHVIERDSNNNPLVSFNTNHYINEDTPGKSLEPLLFAAAPDLNTLEESSREGSVQYNVATVNGAIDILNSSNSEIASEIANYMQGGYDPTQLNPDTYGDTTQGAAILIAQNLPGDITTLGAQVTGTEQEIQHYIFKQEYGSTNLLGFNASPSLEDMKAALLKIAERTKDKGLAMALEEISSTFEGTFEGTTSTLENTILNSSVDPLICLMPSQIEEQLRSKAEIDANIADLTDFVERKPWEGRSLALPMMGNNLNAKLYALRQLEKINEENKKNTLNTLKHHRNLWLPMLFNGFGPLSHHESNEVLFYGSQSNPLPNEKYDRSTGHIFLNVERLLYKYREMRYDQEGNRVDNFSLLEYVKKIWEDVNTACGNLHEFKVNVDHERGNVVRVIDVKYQQETELSLDSIFELKIQSNESICREFAYSSAIPSELSSTIAVSMQNPDAVKDLQAVTFAAFSRQITSRFHISSADKGNQPSAEDKKVRALEFDKLLTDYVNMTQELRKHLIEINSGEYASIDLETGNHDDSDAGEKVGKMSALLNQVVINNAKIYSLYNYTNESRGIYKGFPNTSFAPPVSSIIPLKFNGKLDGISGIVIGHIFKIESSRLPRMYKNSNVGFIVMGEQQEITAQGDWTTTINGQIVVLPSNDLKGYQSEQPLKQNVQELIDTGGLNKSVLTTKLDKEGSNEDTPNANELERYIATLNKTKVTVKILSGGNQLKEAGDITPELLKYAKAVFGKLDELYDYSYEIIITSGNDEHHKNIKSYTSRHTIGKAIDFTINGDNTKYHTDGTRTGIPVYVMNVERVMMGFSGANFNSKGNPICRYGNEYVEASSEYGHFHFSYGSNYKKATESKNEFRGNADRAAKLVNQSSIPGYKIFGDGNINPFD